MYEYKFEEISGSGLFGGVRSIVENAEDWVNECATRGWELVSFSYIPTGEFVCAMRRLVESAVSSPS